VKNKDGKKLKEEGMTQVLSHTPESWKEAAYEVALDCLDKKGEFVGEDIINAIGMPPNHHNAIGATVNSITKRLGLKKIRRVKATRPEQHAREVAVWAYDI
jgi:hypothetical protein